MINKETKEILCTNFCNGRKHDFKLLKESNVKLPPNIQLIIDTGYQGIKKIYKNHEFTMVNNIDWTINLNILDFLRDTALITVHYYE